MDVLVAEGPQFSSFGHRAAASLRPARPCSFLGNGLGVDCDVGVHKRVDEWLLEWRRKSLLLSTRMGDMLGKRLLGREPHVHPEHPVGDALPAVSGCPLTACPLACLLQTGDIEG